MKKIFHFAILFLSATFSFAQKDSTFCGKWRITVAAGEKHPAPTYMLLNNDSTFITSGDSSFADVKQKASAGKWKVTSSGELELIPADTSREIHYYKHQTDWKFIYAETEKNGVKSPVHMMEMDIFVEKITPNSPAKNKSKKKK